MARRLVAATADYKTPGQQHGGQDEHGLQPRHGKIEPDDTIGKQPGQGSNLVQTWVRRCQGRLTARQR